MKIISKCFLSYRFVIGIFYLILVSNCTGKQKEDETFPKDNSTKAVLSVPDTLKPGRIYEKIEISNDPLNTFALYLPKLYDNNSNWPVVFFFDAGGNGALPIDKYYSLADSLGYIFVGSNVSKNGQNIDDAQTIWNTLKNACLNNFSIDKNRILLAGFSGGARTVCNLAAQDNLVNGIIANSAGAQQIDQLLGANKFYIGICGKGDMNRAEMLNIEHYLMGTNVSHFLIEFLGIHEWASNEAMKQALFIATLDTYKKNQSLLRPEILEEFIENQQFKIEKLREENKLVDAYNEQVILLNGTKNLQSIDNITMLDSIKSNPNFLQQKNEMMKINAFETENQQMLYKMIISVPDTILWLEKISNFQKKANNQTMDGQMYQRLLGYASLVCYSMSNRMLMAKNYDLANKLIECYRIADKKNSEVYYFKAIVEGNRKNKLAVLRNIKKSIQLGFTDLKRMKSQQEFDFLRTDTEFLGLIE
ncbi:MAG TPA: hypothetical protein PK323_03125 [Bacteroidia bacterium]|nr:hypothetical protein [Bacteroidia bacterium]